MESKLKAVRAGHKSAVTRLLRKTEEEQDLEIEESTELLETLSQKQKIIGALNEEILNLTKDDDVEDEILQTDEYKFFLNTKIRQLRKTYSNSPTSNITTLPNLSNQSTENTNQHSSVENTYSSVQQQMYHVPPNVTQNHQLPKLTLPTFTGETLMWQTFWDSFESSVQYNPTLTDIQKFTYLKSQLSNEAVRCIDGLPLTSNNYTEAIKLLKERFGQPHKITNAYMQALLDLPAPQYNLLSLRSYYDKKEAYMRGLESLGRSGDSYGALLVPIILNKLPSAVRQNLARENGSDNWEIKELWHGILKEITILEAGLKRTNVFIDTLPSTASFLTIVNNRDYTQIQDRFETDEVIKKFTVYSVIFDKRR
ncbi:uncharacterized protein [Mytilus edulis]|uniref:uncharacterized protein n=1 Tax=Mytilus edulis TaxID=6550 RepID=UPI0039EE8E41